MINCKQVRLYGVCVCTPCSSNCRVLPNRNKVWENRKLIHIQTHRSIETIKKHRHTDGVRWGEERASKALTNKNKSRVTSFNCALCVAWSKMWISCKSEQLLFKYSQSFLVLFFFRRRRRRQHRRCGFSPSWTSFDRLHNENPDNEIFSRFNEADN